ncbi:hypothetical protein AZE42_04513 [Rhizopogon vesiculosus]|uniref:Ubiquitin-like domain-containing protein n=1 Tax=Rhizopogon vesiculosus TaxID=180088 RepID=A0A1J8PY19_9AGAM|nr:hypothetical protein AZE42_04513 [Rhizopogon vesiculosus]
MVPSFYCLWHSLRPYRLIEMPFSLGKVIPIRLRRSTKNGGVPSNSAVNYHDSDNSIPAGIPSALPSPVLASDSSPGHAVSARRESGLQVSTRGASDAVQLSLSVLQAIAGPIPLAGGPMQAAIKGLLATLQAIDTHAQNKMAITSLKTRLYRLYRHLCNAPTAQDPLEQLRRDDLISVLQVTSNQLTKLHKRFLGYQSVTQAIAGCSGELDQYLQEYSLSVQMEMRDILVQQFRGPTAMQPETFTSGYFTLVDATGRERHISVDFGTSYQQLNKLLEVLFVSDTMEAHIQRQYMGQGLYDLCIDKETQVTTLTSQHEQWPRIEAGMKIVMRVIVEVPLPSPSARFQCHSCGASNYSMKGMGKGWTVYCRECKRRYQISIGRRKSNAQQRTIGHRQAAVNINAISTVMQLINNFHVREIVRGS